MKNFRNQRSFEEASDGSVKLSSNGKTTFIEDEKVKTAEFLQVLNIAENN